MTVYYNEIDLKAAAWLRELIKQGHIAEGVVDERSIADVRPEDLAGYAQCHFFAGIGVWSYALRRAGWPDDRPVWTGSCPCQPFSAAGKRWGVEDERHLWPEFFRLIAECRPVTVFGEQVASKDGLAWLDAVHADLEGTGYAVGAIDTCAAGFGAPHIRQRLYFVANTIGVGWGRGVHGSDPSAERQPFSEDEVARSSPTRWMADDDDEGLQGWRRTELQERAGECVVGQNGGVGLVGKSDCTRPQPGRERGAAPRHGNPAISTGGPCAGFWSNAEWIFCRDGKFRAVEPGTFPLAHGAPARVGRLRGYGNAIVAPQATEFIKAYMEVVG